MSISIIYASYNEENNHQFKEGIKRFSSLKEKYSLEIICVDGNSSDGTINFLKKFPVTIIQTKLANRSERYNVAAKMAKGEILLINHPRSLLDINAIEELLNYHIKYEWGAFTHRFDFAHPILIFTSWYSNHIRGDLFKIYYLDHCYFIKKDLFLKINGFPNIAIFEDTELCKRLNKMAKPIRLKSTSTTSAIRFLKNGIIKQAILNQWMKLNYYFSFRPEKMNEVYEKDINLNK